MYLPNSTWTWSFLLVALAQCLISIALEGYVFARFETSLQGSAKPDGGGLHHGGGGGDDTPTNALTIPTYLALFIFGFIYQCVLVWDALRMENTIQVIGICLYNAGMLLYSAVQMNQVDEAVRALLAQQSIDPDAWHALRPYLVAVPCVIALGTVLLSLIAWKLYDEFAWTIYKNISADLRLKRRYLTYQIYIALLKFDFFFFLGFTVQFLVVVQNTSLAEEILTIIALPVTILLLCLAAYFVRRESAAGQVGIMLLYVAGMAYFIFKLVRMYDSPKAPNYYSVRTSLTSFAVLAVILLCVTIVTSALCMRNFGKGLEPHVRGRKARSRRGAAEEDVSKYTSYGGESALKGQSHPLDPVPTRMTID